MIIMEASLRASTIVELCEKTYSVSARTSGVGLISESLARQKGISTIYERVSEACGYRAKHHISNMIFIGQKIDIDAAYAKTCTVT
jgi:hypothetical protein